MRRLGILFLVVGALIVSALGAAVAAGELNVEEESVAGVTPQDNSLADIIHNDDVIVEGNICVSDDDFCVNNEIFQIGTSTGVEVYVKDNVPRIGLVDMDANQDDWILQTTGTRERFELRSWDGASFNTPFRVESRSGNDLLYLHNDYRIGVGTQTPDAQLEVFSDTGAAQLLVDEDDPTAERRVLLALQNNGQPSIMMSNTASGVNWDLRFTQGNAFQINEFNSPTQMTFKRNGALAIKNDADNYVFQLFKGGNLKIGGVLNEASDLNAKHNIAPVDTASVLAKVRSLPISEWSYQLEDTRHVGPMAQDFHAAFGLGSDETSIATLDTSGIALAAIQELALANDELRAANADLASRLAGLEAGTGANGDTATWLAALAALLAAALIATSRRTKAVTN